MHFHFFQHISLPILNRKPLRYHQVCHDVAVLRLIAQGNLISQQSKGAVDRFGAARNFYMPRLDVVGKTYTAARAFP